jgi:hypothetical protein
MASCVPDVIVDLVVVVRVDLDLDRDGDVNLGGERLTTCAGGHVNA